MKASILIKIKEWLSGTSKKPWACIECDGINDETGIGFSMTWNKAFITNLEQRGFQGINQNETVQNFLMFCGAQMLQREENNVNPAEMPNLSSDANLLKI